LNNDTLPDDQRFRLINPGDAVDKYVRIFNEYVRVFIVCVDAFSKKLCKIVDFRSDLKQKAAKMPSSLLVFIKSSVF